MVQFRVWALSIGVCFGIALLIAGICLISTQGANEVPLWFGVTLCPLTSNPTSYISQNLPQGGACAAVLYANDTQPQTFTIEKWLFSNDGLEYHPILFRSTTSATVQFKLEDASGKLLFAEGPVTVSNDGTSTSAEDAQVMGDSNPSMRRLMKGGRGGGSSGRSRSGSGARYGTRSYVYTTSYGYSSCCITSGAIIYVYRPGPLTRTGFYDTDDTAKSNCGNPSEGCEYELPTNMNRDEFARISFVPDGSLEYPLKLTVAKASVSSPAGEPQLYFSFWTNDPDNKAIASYILIPLGCVIFVAAIILFFVARSCFD